MPSPYCTTDDVLARLRMDVADRDALYVADCTTAACELIDDRLTYYGGDGIPIIPSPPYPVRLKNAAIGAAIRIYRYKDAESDVADTWNGGALPIRIPRDPLAGFTNLIDPSRHAWAVA